MDRFGGGSMFDSNNLSLMVVLLLFVIIIATALGLGIGKTDLDLTRDLFKLQMRQAKRLWTADWAESSLRHGESCMQNAQQHAESQAIALATYFQAEKLASQQIKLARDQDSRSYEQAWRAEVRESLRDDLSNQNNRFNIIMLCDTVCLGCVFTLVADGSPPIETSSIMIHLYVISMGISVMLFSISLWCSVLVVRRLHEHTASTLERKFFAQSEELKKVWQHQLHRNLPTGPKEMYLLNQAYEKWLADYLEPLGRTSIHLMSVGVVGMFVTAGLLIHNQYLITYNTPTAVPIFWSIVVITSTILLSMKWAEDRQEKKKQGVYDNSWYDHESDTGYDTGPFAKIVKAAEQLFSSTSVALASMERMESLHKRERRELELVGKTKFLHQRMESLRKESEQRAKTRKDVLQLLTTAAEELDALPEELTSNLNKLLHEIDEADCRTASYLASTEQALQHEASSADWSRLARLTPLSQVRSKEPMTPHPIDAQRLPVSLVSLRKKLGENTLTTLLRIKNFSDEPLRLKSGVQLKDGKYIKRINANDPLNNNVCYHLYPGSEIPPRTEIVVAARNAGGWIPTSGIEGELVYTNRDESWAFNIKFRSELVRSFRRCQVKAYRTNDKPDGNDDENDDDKNNDSAGDDDNADNDESEDQYWQISKDEVDRKANNEVVISIDVLRGVEATKAELSERQSQINLMAGYLQLQKKKTLGIGLWQQQWVVLTPTDIVFSPNLASKKKLKIPLRDISSVSLASDIVKKYVFEIHTSFHMSNVTNNNSQIYRFSAPTSNYRDDWIQKISDATGLDVTTTENLDSKLTRIDSVSSQSTFKDGIECVQNDFGTEVLPV